MSIPLPSFRRGRDRGPGRTVIAGLLLVLAGCDDQAAVRPGDVRVYQAAKESTPRGPSETAPAAPAVSSPADPLALRYEPPPGWRDQGASGMRLASLAIGAAGDGHEVTVIPAAGTLEANVSRWISQLDPAADAAALADRTATALAAAETVEVDGAKVTVVLLTSTAGTDQPGDEAILGAAIPVDGKSSLFVKFKGPVDVARRERDNFVRFISSIRWK